MKSMRNFCIEPEDDKFITEQSRKYRVSASAVMRWILALARGEKPVNAPAEFLSDALKHICNRTNN